MGEGESDVVALHLHAGVERPRGGARAPVRQAEGRHREPGPHVLLVPRVQIVWISAEVGGHDELVLVVIESRPEL